MSLSSLGSLASTAFDTARSTVKAMAEAVQADPSAAAVTGSGSGAPAVAPVAAAPAPGKPIEAAVAAAEATPPKPAKGQRVGTVLDAFA